MNRFSLLAASLALTLSSNAFADPVLQNPGFESGDFTGWTQGGNYNTGNSFTSVTTSDPSNGYYVFSGTYAAALGPNVNQGTLTQNFVDTPGQKYNLTFELHGDANDGNTNNYFNASVGTGAGLGQLSLTNLLGGYQLYSVPFTGSGNDSVLFSFLNNDNYLNLDDAGVASVAPEPSSLVLLGTAVLGAAGFTRRRFFKA